MQMAFCLAQYTPPPRLGTPTTVKSITLSVTGSPVLSDPSLKHAPLFTFRGMRDPNVVRCGDLGVYAQVSLPFKSSVSEGPEVRMRCYAA